MPVPFRVFAHRKPRLPGLAAALAGIALAAGGAPLQTRAPANATEKELSELVPRFYEAIASEDAARRRDAFASLAAGREDLDFLLGARNAALVWPRVEERLPAALADPPRMSGRSTRDGWIDNILTTNELADMRENSGRYAGFLALIPPEVPAFKVVTHRVNGQPDAVSGPYLYVRGRWILLPEGERLPAALRRLKAQDARRRHGAGATGDVERATGETAVQER